MAKISRKLWVYNITPIIEKRIIDYLLWLIGLLPLKVFLVSRCDFWVFYVKKKLQLKKYSVSHTSFHFLLSCGALSIRDFNSKKRSLVKCWKVILKIEQHFSFDKHDRYWRFKLSLSVEFLSNDTLHPGSLDIWRKGEPG